MWPDNPLRPPLEDPVHGGIRPFPWPGPRADFGPMERTPCIWKPVTPVRATRDPHFPRGGSSRTPCSPPAAAGRLFPERAGEGVAKHRRHRARPSSSSVLAAHRRRHRARPQPRPPSSPPAAAAILAARRGRRPCPPPPSTSFSSASPASRSPLPPSELQGLLQVCSKN